MTPIRHQLALNENFSLHLPGVQEAIRDSLKDINLTLDALSTGLSTALAEHLDVPVRHVFVSPGSGALLLQLLNAYAGNGAEVVHAWPSFDMYPLLIRNAGGIPVPVPLKEFSHDLDAMAAAVTPQTRVVVLCNPNNPTGTMLGEAELKEFLDRLPSDVLVLVDEAYLDFADPDSIANAIDLHRGDPRVCAVRSFSKSYGLLGMRVGYLVADPAVTSALAPTSPFLRVSTPAQAAALAALKAETHMRRQCAEVSRERDRVHRALTELGYRVPGSEANFHWLPLGEDNGRFVEFCADNGVSVREIAGAGVRVTVGTPEANDAVIELARRFAGGAPPGAAHPSERQ
ncbi:aminotransferase class I/II-fold pyridoxal phosphate-dependent enzyme [Streptomyces sp. NBC_00986]|uniref:aminotransferase class I/II-fold pyridoxal phosphate-dependent enzyme n=1 Tax=Streptomyces sp. NBC_00986 TaxID=2903702 RepID=UPI003867A338|nr:aminotransferase class I/II-fold pyridoxal phosphate-dependent enzyme [Streptomyces sp. NBC_00986]